MLLVKTRLHLSPIHGVGLFAAEFIPANTVVWRFHLLIDIRITAEQLADLPAPAHDAISAYCYRQRTTGLYVLCGDDARFFNHSDTPSCRDVPDGDESGITIAARDISIGEELTCDYAAFDQDYIEGKYVL